MMFGLPFHGNGFWGGFLSFVWVWSKRTRLGGETDAARSFHRLGLVTIGFYDLKVKTSCHGGSYRMNDLRGFRGAKSSGLATNSSDCQVPNHRKWGYHFISQNCGNP